jgi:hypothetical protein
VAEARPGRLPLRGPIRLRRIRPRLCPAPNPDHGLAHGLQSVVEVAVPSQLGAVRDEILDRPVAPDEVHPNPVPALDLVPADMLDLAAHHLALDLPLSVGDNVLLLAKEVIRHQLFAVLGENHRVRHPGLARGPHLFRCVDVRRLMSGGGTVIVDGAEEGILLGEAVEVDVDVEGMMQAGIGGEEGIRARPVEVDLDLVRGRQFDVVSDSNKSETNMLGSKIENKLMAYIIELLPQFSEFEGIP